MDRLIEILKQIKIATDIDYYYTTTDIKSKLPYICYLDYGESYRYSNNKIINTITNVQIDYYTDKAFDENKNIIKQYLNDNEIPFEYGLDYDDKEQVYHHFFDCEVV